MQHKQLREKFFNFFGSRGYKRMPSSSLIPEEDDSVLLTTAGMQQFKPYFTGELDPIQDSHPHTGTPLGQNKVITIQKSFRTTDINEVGDETHLTFFEMLGNFAFDNSLNKEEAILEMWEFLTTELEISPERLSATYFQDSDAGIDPDTEAKRILESIPDLDRITGEPKSENFWGPTGDQGPCGPTVEFFVDGVEIWNLVFNQYSCDARGNLDETKNLGVDTGGGLERLLVSLQDADNIFETDVFHPLMEILEGEDINPDFRSERIVADHARSIVLLSSEGIEPDSKDEKGSILKRLIRRFVVHLKQLNALDRDEDLLNQVFMIYQDIYQLDKQSILKNYQSGKEEVIQAIERGMPKLETLIEQWQQSGEVDGAEAHNLVATHGFPQEMLKTKVKEAGLDFDDQGYIQAEKKHQKVSRKGESKAGGHGLGDDDLPEEESEMMTKLHTATHLLNAALREFLGDQVSQAGSDINPERLRFDFTFDRALTDEEIDQIESWVNDQIEKELPVICKEMDKERAIEEEQAIHIDHVDYPETVKVYYIGDPETAVSKELCGGPHVGNTGALGKFEIIKESSSSAGVRRIRATLK